MNRLLKFLIGLALLPLCWSASRAFFSLLRVAVPSGGSIHAEWALPAGFVVAAAGFFLLPRPFRTYVLAHELTHAIWGLLLGAKVGRMKVGKEGGHVLLSKNNFLIALAPYFFPFYTGLTLALWWLVGLFWNLEAYRPWWLALVGLTWGFHLTFTVYMLSQTQPDVQEQGRLFSYTVIYLSNLLFVSLWLIGSGPAEWRASCGALLTETVGAYRAVGLATAVAWRRMNQWYADFTGVE